MQAQYQQRSQIVERRFGQIKQHDGFRRWTVWGLVAMRTQWSLLCTTLNPRVLYQRWRSNPAPSPKTAAARTCWTIPAGNWLAALPRQVRATQEAVAAIIERYAGWLPYWST